MAATGWLLLVRPRHRSKEMADIAWECVAREALHPLRFRIIVRAAADPSARFSPSQLAVELGAPLGNVSYHVRQLLAQRLLARAGTATRRGAVEHYYRAGDSLLA
jgi:DNA-binding MarR family transcriptional regulator